MSAGTARALVWTVLLGICSCQRPKPESGGNNPEPAPKIAVANPLDTLPDTALVDISLIDSTIILDIRYATRDNFTARVLYPCARCFLRKSVGLRLARVNAGLKKKGYTLKVFDCYRPRSVQYVMWELAPDSRFVANPDRASVHNRGAGVDLTIVDSEGHELDMGSGFDEFSERSRTDFAGLTEEQANNRWLLREAMEREGFSGIKSEWWHFEAYDKERYSVLDVPFDCDECK